MTNKRNPELNEIASALSHDLLAYVYVLRDPTLSGKPIFYVGKGRGRRALTHQEDAKSADEETLKLRRIQAIQRAGREPVIEIVRHRMTDEEAFKVEASVIDVLLSDSQTSRNLVNQVRGHGTKFGLASLRSLNAKYTNLKEAPIDGPEILVIRLKPTKIVKARAESIGGGVTRSVAGWWPTISDEELYSSTRAWWRIRKDIEQLGISHCVAVVDQISRAVFRIDEWITRPSDGRRAFIGEMEKSGLIHRTYLGAHGKLFSFSQGVQSPVLYWPPKNK